MIEILEEIKRRKELVINYFRNFDELRVREPAKASEFLWGAVNSLVYTIGLLHGRKITKYSEVISLLKELGIDKELIDACQIIHANFYHDFMDQETFEGVSSKVIKLLEKLDKILEQELKKLNSLKVE